MHYERTLQIPPKPRRGLWKVALLLAALSVSACKKSGEEKKASLLSSGKWTLQRFEYHKKDGTWDYYTPSVPFTLEFRGDKTATVINSGGSTICTWVLSGDQTQLTIARASGSADTYAILQLSSSTLQLTPVGHDPTPYTEERDTYVR